MKKGKKFTTETLRKHHKLEKEKKKGAKQNVLQRDNFATRSW